MNWGFLLPRQILAGKLLTDIIFVILIISDKTKHPVKQEGTIDKSNTTILYNINIFIKGIIIGIILLMSYQMNLYTGSRMVAQSTTIYLLFLIYIIMAFEAKLKWNNTSRKIKFDSFFIWTTVVLGFIMLVFTSSTWNLLGYLEMTSLSGEIWLQTTLKLVPLIIYIFISNIFIKLFKHRYNAKFNKRISDEIKTPLS